MLKIKDLATLLSKFHANSLTEEEKRLLQCWKSEPVFKLLKCLKSDPDEFEKKITSTILKENIQPVKHSSIRQINHKVKMANAQGIHVP